MELHFLLFPIGTTKIQSVERMGEEWMCWQMNWWNSLKRVYCDGLKMPNGMEWKCRIRISKLIHNCYVKAPAEFCCNGSISCYRQNPFPYTDIHLAVFKTINEHWERMCHSLEIELCAVTIFMKLEALPYCYSIMETSIPLCGKCSCVPRLCNIIIMEFKGLQAASSISCCIYIDWVFK